MYGRRLAQVAGRRYGKGLSTGASGGAKKQPPTPSAGSGAGNEGEGKVASFALKSLGVGATAGTLGSLVGMGGGFVAIPCLTGWLKLTQHQAHGTSLGAVFATGAAGSSAYALSGLVDYQAATAMAVAGMAAAHLGARSTAGMSPTALKLALGVLMIVVAPLLPLRDKLSSLEKEGEVEGEEVEGGEGAGGVAKGGARSEELSLKTSTGPSSSPISSSTTSSSSSSFSSSSPSSTSSSFSSPERSSERSTENSQTLSVAHSAVGEEEKEDLFFPGSGKVMKMCMIGLGSGFLAGVFGVGGGVVTVPAISLATDLGHKEVLGTSLAAMVLPALTGSVTHFRQGNLIPRIAIPLAVGTGLGAFVGGKYAARHLDEESLKWAFSGLMLVMGARTVVGARVALIAARRLA